MRFTLQPRTWYAMEYSFPSGGLHVSPIYVFETKPRHTGKRQLGVRFFHANYPEGAQEKEYTLTVLHREESFLAALQRHAPAGSEACALVLLRPLSLDWLKPHFPAWHSSLDTDEPLPTQLDRILRGAR